MTLSPRDESLLGWFFGTGQCAFERSTVGPMLERAEMFGNEFTGVAVREEGRLVIHQLAYERLRRDPTPWGRVTDGAIVTTGREITARPTAETRSASGYTPNLADLDRYAEVSRVLGAVERRSVLLVAAIEAYFGDLGAQWAARKRPGRLASMYHLTAAGRRLLEGSAAEARAKGQPVIGNPARRMANEIDRDKKPERVRVALMRCDRQALELRAEACAAWDASRREAARRAGLTG